MCEGRLSVCLSVRTGGAYLSHFVPGSAGDCNEYLACKSFVQLGDAISELCAQELHPLANLSFPVSFLCFFQDPLKPGALVRLHLERFTEKYRVNCNLLMQGGGSELGNECLRCQQA